MFFIVIMIVIDCVAAAAVWFVHFCIWDVRNEEYLKCGSEKKVMDMLKDGGGVLEIYVGMKLVLEGSRIKLLLGEEILEVYEPNGRRSEEISPFHMKGPWRREVKARLLSIYREPLSKEKDRKIAEYSKKMNLYREWRKARD